MYNLETKISKVETLVKTGLEEVRQEFKEELTSMNAAAQIEAAETKAASHAKAAEDAAAARKSRNQQVKEPAPPNIIVVM